MRKHPYKFDEFFNKVTENIEVPDYIEYVSADRYPTGSNGYAPADSYIRNYEFDVFTRTAYGSNEGIYTDVYIQGKYSAEDSDTVHIGTIKTLYSGEEYLRKMYDFAATIYIEARNFINLNIEDFTWLGYNIQLSPGANYYYEVMTEERIIEKLAFLKRKDVDISKVIITDNSTKKNIDISKFYKKIDERMESLV